jgi:hypothetical protein
VAGGCGLGQASQQELCGALLLAHRETVTARGTLDQQIDHLASVGDMPHRSDEADAGDAHGSLRSSGCERRARLRDALLQLVARGAAGSALGTWGGAHTLERRAVPPAVDIHDGSVSWWRRAGGGEMARARLA